MLWVASGSAARFKSIFLCQSDLDGPEYVGEDGNRHRPVMLHRAIVGSMERFIGILIEQHAGALPVWLAPQQVKRAVLNITERRKSDYVQEIVAKVQKVLPDHALKIAADSSQ